MGKINNIKKMLVVGGCGFIGSNFCRYIFEKWNDRNIVNLDKLTYAGNPENLADYENHPQYSFIKGDACDPEIVEDILADGIDIIVNFAAESHVDRSIADPGEVVRNNFLLTENLLAGALRHSPRLFIQISTDEVYGSLGESGVFTEETPLNPRNPYAASKAAADVICRAYNHTFALPVTVIRCSNNYGPYQFPEKFIPLFITNALEDKPLPLYGDGLHVRDWIFVRDFCAAINAVIESGISGETFNVGGASEMTNQRMAETILDILGKPHSMITHVKDRQGHDRRYAMGFDKIRNKIGWEPTVPLEKGIALTVEWYKNNRKWWERIKSGEYAAYYREHYHGRHGLTE